MDGATPRLQELIREATAPDLLLRTETASDFLAALDLVEEDLTGPPQESLADPLEAKPGDMLPHNLKVLRRLGSGTGAIALLVQRGEEILVLKYAREAKDNGRIEKEFRIVSDLRHELIVGVKDLLTFPGGNKGFLMEYAGEWDRKKVPAIDDEPRRDTRILRRKSRTSWKSGPASATNLEFQAAMKGYSGCSSFLSSSSRVFTSVSILNETLSPNWPLSPAEK
jgi:hypothetical protein